MGQATGADNGSDFFQNFRIFDLYLLLFQELADLISERTSYTSDGKEMKISGGRNPVEIANGRANETTKWYFPDDNDGLIKVDSNP